MYDIIAVTLNVGVRGGLVGTSKLNEDSSSWAADVDEGLLDEDGDDGDDEFVVESLPAVIVIHEGSERVERIGKRVAGGGLDDLTQGLKTAAA